MRIRARLLVPALSLSLTGALVPAASLAGQAAPITVFVVRHAEKGPEPTDPTLTPAGEQRAEALSRALEEVRVSALFATEFKRTQETVAPLARRLGLTPTIIPARETDRLVEAIRALPAGSNAVVASHSNLVPAIVAKLSRVTVGELTDADYDRLYVITLLGSGSGITLVLRYGAPSAAGAAGPMKP